MNKELSDSELYSVYTSIWQNIAREDSNASSRIGFAISLTSGQFTAIAFMAARLNDYSYGSEWPLIVSSGICILSLLGMFFCFRTRVGVAAAHEQISYLRSRYEHHEDQFKRLCLPRPFGANTGHQPGRKSSQVYPIALFAVWSLILTASLIAVIWNIARL